MAQLLSRPSFTVLIAGFHMGSLKDLRLILGVAWRQTRGPYTVMPLILPKRFCLCAWGRQVGENAALLQEVRYAGWRAVMSSLLVLRDGWSRCCVNTRCKVVRQWYAACPRVKIVLFVHGCQVVPANIFVQCAFAWKLMFQGDHFFTLISRLIVSGGKKLSFSLSHTNWCLH